MHLKATQMPIGILIKTISILILQYYIFDIKERYDDVHGDIIIVGLLHYFLICLEVNIFLITFSLQWKKTSMQPLRYLIKL